MRLGIGSYTFGWAVGVPGHRPPRPLDEHDLLDRARELSVDLLQIGDNLPLHTFDPARLDRLAERAAHEGVRLEIGARRLTSGRVAVYADIARRVGASFVRFVIDDADYRPEAAAVTALLRETEGELDGLTLGIENHDRFAAGTLRDIVEAVGSERVGVCLDTANSLGAGEGLDAVVDILAPLTVNLHVKDFRIERPPHLMGFCVTGTPAGSGVMELPALLERLVPFGRCRSAILELWTPPEPRLQETLDKEAAWAVRSLDYLRPFFA